MIYYDHLNQLKFENSIDKPNKRLQAQSSLSTFIFLNISKDNNLPISLYGMLYGVVCQLLGVLPLSLRSMQYDRKIFHRFSMLVEIWSLPYHLLSEIDRNKMYWFCCKRLKTQIIKSESCLLLVLLLRVLILLFKVKSSTVYVERHKFSKIY